jgi:hypothetical protein
MSPGFVRRGARPDRPGDDDTMARQERIDDEPCGVDIIGGDEMANTH